MPLVKPKAEGEEGSQRGSRPPWVRDGPPALPMPSAPWLPKKRESQTRPSPQQPLVTPTTTQIQRQDTKPEKTVNTIQIQRQDTKPEKTVTTVQSQRQDTKPGKTVTTMQIQKQDTKPEKTVATMQTQRQDTKPGKTVNTIHIQRQDTKPEKTVNTIQIQRQDTKPEKTVNTTQIQKQDTKPEKMVTTMQIQKPDTKPEKTVTTIQTQKQDTKPGKTVNAIPILKQDTKTDKHDEPRKKVHMSDELNIMDGPTMPPAPPPPPPMATSKPPIDVKPLSTSQIARLDALKSRPRKRPDWTDMMKEVEQGVKLKRVKCNDRSAPVIPKAKAKGQFVYESEKDNAHNLLLKEIQGGIRLKKVRCNDRSKPILDGLRKFRRQMTIEEQIVKKSTSMADVVAMAAQPDELDDIDKVRDDLQSTKQMLAHELRNKETLERENKRLLARLLNLEAELEKEKASRSVNQDKGELVQIRTAQDDKLICKLKDEATDASKMMKQMEEMYKKTAEELDVTRAKLESAWLQNAQMEQEWKNIQNHPDASPVLPKLASSKKLANASFSARPVLMSSSEEESDEESEEESDSVEEDDGGANTAAQLEKRTARELKLATAKLRSVKEKKYNAKKEKVALKHQFYNLTKCLNAEKKRYRQLEKEVDKMAKLVKDVDEEEDDQPEQEDQDSEETESEIESDESEDSEDSEGGLPESASSQDKINNLTRRLKQCENRLTTLKKCNYLLKANIDRRQDEINKQKEVILSLQEDLNAVLAELG